MDDVEIITRVERVFGIHIDEYSGEDISTPRRLRDAIVRRIGFSRTEFCLKKTLYQGLCRGFHESGLIQQAKVSLETPLSQLATRGAWSRSWPMIRARGRLVHAPDVAPQKGVIAFRKATVRSVVFWLACLDPRSRPSVEGGWTLEQIGLEIRRIVADVVDLVDYSDDENFADDMGIS